ncbi:hypothetical protein ASG82_22525 [Mycobacterium sp. Soil538]|nr:hypothetical protein ASG82_22525 [Mycobacterium sp. Soil538]
MDEIFRGSEALSAGLLTRGALRYNFRRIFPDIYIAATAQPSLRDRTVGASLWSRGSGVIAGHAAAALHGAQWIDDRVDVEMIRRCPRPPRGIVVRNETISDDEITSIDGILVTTPARTAFDLARHLPRGYAVICLDAVARATGVGVRDVLAVADRYPAARWGRYAMETAELMDGGAETPAATNVRLLLRREWEDVPDTRIKLGTDVDVDIGYRGPKVALDVVEKDYTEIFNKRRGGLDLRTEFARKARYVARAGWIYILVFRQVTRSEVLAQTRNAFRKRGYVPRRGGISLY